MRARPVLLVDVDEVLNVSWATGGRTVDKRCRRLG
jgi:hypothetical protein